MSSASPPDRIHPRLALAWSEHLCDQGAKTFAAYAWVPSASAAVLGLGQRARRELHLRHLQEDGVAVLRRASGGGAVLLAPGVLCFGCLAPASALGGGCDIHRAFHELTAPVIEALRGLGIAARTAGISDIAVPCPGKPAGADPAGAAPLLRKVAGCAQLRRRRTVLVHGSLLVDAPLHIFSRYLAFPSRVPDYRQGREHARFCCNLAEIAEPAVDAGRIAACLQAETSRRGWQWRRVPAALPAGAEALLLAKYDDPAWNLHGRGRRRRAGE